MPEFVRVRVKGSGHHVTITRQAAERSKVFEVLKQDAVDVNGRPLPPKHKTTLASAGVEATTATTHEAKEATA